VVGIVTDRDLVIRLIAEGRAPEATPVSSVMTQNPVTCREDDDVHEALNAMSGQQIRRIPVVDNEGRLCGIIAQADVARYLDERQAGEVLEDISQPGRNAVGRAFRHTGDAVRNWQGGAWVALGVGAAIGAGVMALVGQRRSEFADRPSSTEVQSTHSHRHSSADDIPGSYL
jgi:hypothetical protein